MMARAKPVIVPGIIARNQKELDEMLKKVPGKASRIMLDVMDGVFVPNHSLDFDFKLSRNQGFEYEAHLMTVKPLEWIEKHREKVDIAILQVETVDNLAKAISFAREKGLKVTLGLNPETSLERVLPHLKDVDAVLILTVNPGSFCVEFLPETLEKIKELRRIDGNIPIEVDGCMDPENARRARKAGANIFASGSYVLKSDDPDRSLKELLKAVK